MKLLHVSDLHLGRPLHGRSRIPYQAQLCAEISKLVVEHGCSVVLLSGDIFDTVNPPADAERLYFDFLDSLTSNRNVAVVVIAGNHDSDKRLEAPAGILRNRGIFIFTSSSLLSPMEGNEPFPWSYSNGVLGLSLMSGAIQVVPLPFMSEYRLGIALTGHETEHSERRAFQEQVVDIIDQRVSNLSDGIPSVLMVHQHFQGGTIDDTERDVTMGGSYTLDTAVIKGKFDYVAAGHLHRPQRIASNDTLRYCGSPMAFQFESNPLERGVVLIDTDDEFATEFLPLADPCPLRVWRYTSYENLIADLALSENQNFFLEVHLEGTPDAERTRTIMNAHPRVLSVQLVGLNGVEESNARGAEKRLRMSEEEVFVAFCESRGKPAGKELLEVFREILATDEAANP